MRSSSSYYHSYYHRISSIPLAETDSHCSGDPAGPLMALIEIYPPPRSKDYKTVKTSCGPDDEKEKCCGTTFLCKKVIAAFILFIALPVLIFFIFAIVPIRYNRRPVPALTTSPSKTTGVIRVLLVGQFSLLIFCIFCSCIILVTNALCNFSSR